MLAYCIESTDYLMDEEAFFKGYAQVPAYRQVKIDKQKRPEDKRLSLGAELLLERLLRENGFADLAENRRGYYTKSGKPYILRPDQVPGEDAVPPVHISISHSKNYTMVVLSDTVVGCDIEFANASNANCLALARRFYNAEEAREVEADKSVFYKLWTLKEAYTKCTQVPLPTVLKMSMKDAFAVQKAGSASSAAGKPAVKMLQGEKDGFAWSVVYRA